MILKVDKDERGQDFIRWCHEKNYFPIDKEYVTANTMMRYRCSCGATRHAV